MFVFLLKIFISRSTAFLKWLTSNRIYTNTVNITSKQPCSVLKAADDNHQQYKERREFSETDICDGCNITSWNQCRQMQNVSAQSFFTLFFLHKAPKWREVLTCLWLWSPLDFLHFREIVDKSKTDAKEANETKQRIGKYCISYEERLKEVASP